MRKLDDTDRRILRIMMENPDLSSSAIASRAGLSPTPCWRRIEKMRAEGVILGKSVDIDWRALGYEVRVFLRVTVEKTAARALDEFINAAKAHPEIVTIQTLLGTVDVRMDVIARDLAHYQDIYRSKILTLPHILDIESLMLVSEIKNTEHAPI